MLFLYVKFTNFIDRLVKDEDGVTAIEYALIAAAVVAGIGLLMKTIGNNTSTYMGSVATAI
ncbi:Flp family type IVb pilin [Polynucleobacter sp. UB-Tiil-W10]|uniref:Flp family type IVb pilin n=1 Tax=Polynucleobacter sp. UB-Tiil-W10 TaxID=1855648 RepID=UPI001C0E5585|nr:Flp family type IVb pilin [Polynucleobacter sp. UB-Tiil-W10]MBU3541640.1 Flp family type IVb pilin [Polynucleobacter sp. UB-Tiil-W10]